MFPKALKYERAGLLAGLFVGSTAFAQSVSNISLLDRSHDNDEVDNQLRSSAGTMPATPTAAELTAWRLKVETRAATVFGLAYPSYVRARVQSIITDAAAVIAQARGFPPESYQARFVADVLQQWARS